MEKVIRFLLAFHQRRTYQILELGTVNLARLTVNAVNYGEPAYEPELIVEHHSAMAFSARDSDVRVLCKLLMRLRIT